MPDPIEDPLPQLLRAARGGSAEALGRALDACRAYLLQVARRELDPDLEAKGGPSDVVQQTMLEAVRDFDRFQGESEAELRAWLRRLLLNNLVGFARLYRETGKRQIGREVRLGAGSSSGGGIPEPATDASSPSRQAIRREESLALRDAVGRLPEDYRRVLHLRYQEGQSFEEIGRRMDLTPNAARKLWLRAVRRLREETGGAS